MSEKLAKKVAALYLGRLRSRRSKTASATSGRGPSLPEGDPPPQILPDASSEVASWIGHTCDWHPEWPEEAAWQHLYSAEVDQHHETPTNRIRLRLRTCTGEKHHLTAHIGVNLETGRHEVIRRTGATEIKGFPEEGHTLHTVLGWIGEDEYSKREVYLPDAHDPDGGRWETSMDLNVKYRVIGQLTALSL